MALLAQSPSHSSQRRAPRPPEEAPPAVASATRSATSTPPAKPAPTAGARAAQSLVEAELAFARAAEQSGTGAAFLGVLDDTGVLFRPGPVNGKAWLRAQKPDPSKLRWFPSFVEVSEAGDLGYSTGPYEWRSGAAPEKAAHGHFVSIWGRRGGSWKLLLDTGSSHAAPEEEDPVFEPQNPKEPAKIEPAPPFSAGALQNLEAEFSRAASIRGTLPAYNIYLASDARFYRPGSPPTSQLDDIRKALEKSGGARTWTCLGSAVARSNDLGYAYGISEHSHGPKGSIFLHVWKRQPSGRWKVVLDIETPLP